MQNTHYICPICDGNENIVIFENNYVPIFCNVQYPDYESAVKSEAGELLILFCVKCSHVFNAKYNASLVEYSSEYNNTLSFSSVYNEHSNSVISNLIDDYSVRNKSILEVGCGDGLFLTELCNRGNNRGTGYDPASMGKSCKNVVIINEVFDSAKITKKYDIALSSHVLEHFANPQHFINNIKSTIVSDGLLFFEVPNGEWILKEKNVWDFIYEHYSYFSLESLERLLNILGLESVETKPTFSNQYIQSISKTNFGNLKESRRKNNSSNLRSEAVLFWDEVNEKILFWQEFLLSNKDKKIVIWGAGSKGVMFLSLCDKLKQIKFAVDVNPIKQNNFIPLSGQRIVSVEYILDYKPDIVLIMNGIYEEEIKNIISKQGLEPELKII